MRNRKEGFTLIELLIVIAIIGILAAVLIPNLLNARERAFSTGAQSCLKELSTLEETYQVDYQQYAAANGTLQTEYGTVAACANINLTDGGDSQEYAYTGVHQSGGDTYDITPAGGLVRQ